MGLFRGFLRVWANRGFIGRQLIRAKQAQAGTAEALDRPFVLQLSQDRASHLTARSHEAGQVGPSENRRLTEEELVD
jgi:hypothetical protein